MLGGGAGLCRVDGHGEPWFGTQVEALPGECEVTDDVMVEVLDVGAVGAHVGGAGVKGFRGGGAYVAAKHGVVGLTKSAALDYAASQHPGERRLPGIIDTAMMHRFSGGTPEGRAAVIAQEPIRRMGTPEEIAAAVLWLCSDAASFVVGHADGHRRRPNGVATATVILPGRCAEMRKALGLPPLCSAQGASLANFWRVSGESGPQLWLYRANYGTEGQRFKSSRARYLTRRICRAFVSWQ